MRDEEHNSYEEKNEFTDDDQINEPEKLTMYDQQQELTEEEFIELVLAEQEKSLRQPPVAKKKKKSLFSKWMMITMSFVLLLSSFSILFEILSIPAVQFLKTSTTLSKDEAMAPLKESVVVITAENSKGTGFSISSDGQIITNYHVIEGKKIINVLFPNHGTFQATVTESYPDIDVAVLSVEGNELPYVNLAERLPETPELPVRFIGNPLSFHLIINEGHLLSYTTLQDWEQPVMMMEAPVYRGNSGSPVFNEDLEVIGIVFATLQTEQYGKVGLVIPIEYLFEKRLNKHETKTS